MLGQSATAEANKLLSMNRRHKAQMDPALISTDAWLKRWANDGGPVGPRTPMHPLERIRLLGDGAVFRQGYVPPAAEIEFIDEILKDSPQDVRAFVEMWYLDRAPVITKADRLGVSRSAIYARWGNAVSYIRGRLHAKGVKV